MAYLGHETRFWRRAAARGWARQRVQDQGDPSLPPFLLKSADELLEGLHACSSNNICRWWFSSCYPHFHNAVLHVLVGTCEFLFWFGYPLSQLFPFSLSRKRKKRGYKCVGTALSLWADYLRDIQLKCLKRLWVWQLSVCFPFSFLFAVLQ